MHLLSLRPDQAVLCCICAWNLTPAHVSCRVGGSVSERSLESRLVETASLLNYIIFHYLYSFGLIINFHKLFFFDLVKQNWTSEHNLKFADII